MKGFAAQSFNEFSARARLQGNVIKDYFLGYRHHAGS